MFRWIKNLVLIIVLAMVFVPLAVQAKDNKVDIYFFYGKGCPHCAKEEVLFKTLEEKYDNLVIHKYEVWYNTDNQKLLKKVAKALDKDVTGVPFTVIGKTSYIGYSETEMPKKLEDNIIFYSTHSADETIKNVVNENITLPLLGTINAKSFSLPIITIVIGFLDGFNPCSLWVLLFMMSVLLSMKDKKKLAYIGLAFILTSAITYYAFMAAWLNLTMFIGGIKWIRYLIAIVAVGGGTFNVRSALKNKDGGCEVVGDEKRTKMFDRIKHFTKQNSLMIAIFGTMLIAVSVNLIDMLCSAGLPVIYSEILKMNHVSGIANYGYLLLYNFFFMLDDIIVYVIALKTMQLKGISTKFGNYSHLIGGIIMVIVGILLAVKPGLLMFG